MSINDTSSTPSPAVFSETAAALFPDLQTRFGAPALAHDTERGSCAWFNVDPDGAAVVVVRRSAARDQLVAAEALRLVSSAASRGLRVRGCYVMSGVLGTERMENRPDLQALIAMARNGECTDVLVTSVDRLSRDVSTLHELLSELKRGGARLWHGEDQAPIEPGNLLLLGATPGAPATSNTGAGLS